MEYKEYLKTERWQEIRKNLLESAEYRCQVCNNEDELHVHHRSYDRLRTEEEINDLIVLCEDCHAKFHKKISKVDKKLRQERLRELSYKITSHIKKGLVTEGDWPWCAKILCASWGDPAGWKDYKNWESYKIWEKKYGN